MANDLGNAGLHEDDSKPWRSRFPCRLCRDFVSVLPTPLPRRVAGSIWVLKDLTESRKCTDVRGF
ncbi:hypothetical protein GALMADRAFT_132656 [Galerina marginata CBS 339.88]|uniref:Uncharacterized protein n=1 Tax=Galerina marginata (strain CBS 339.88) TaxID=685588 RepID=A0A067TS62_GALM3|nr:hypothetical protein GALMADRAFT_132656 [Galerina marginata CBS 339.88]